MSGFFPQKLYFFQLNWNDCSFSKYIFQTLVKIVQFSYEKTEKKLMNLLKALFIEGDF